MRGAKEFVRVAAGTGIGRAGEDVLALGVVQGVVEPCDRARGVAERRMRRHIVDALAVDVDLAAVAQAREIFRARERPSLGSNGVLGLHPAMVPRLSDAASA